MVTCQPGFPAGRAKRNPACRRAPGRWFAAGKDARPAHLAACVLALCGCATVQPRQGFEEVRTLVEDRMEQRIHWRTGGAEDQEVDRAIAALLAIPLHAEAAVQIALLNNRHLQATFEELNIAQADLVAAGLLRNPIFEAEIRFADAGTSAEFSLVQEFLAIFQIPLRERIAAAAFAGAQAAVASTVLDLAGAVRESFYDYQAALQLIEMRQTVMAATEAALDLAQRMHDAGNITDRQFALERAQHEQAKLALAATEMLAAAGREQLNALMGVWGADTMWSAAARLPELPEDDGELDTIERAAIENSLDLAIRQREIEGLGERLGLERTFGLVPELETGVTSEREHDGEWGVGPAVSLPLPIFNQGQPAVAVAAARLEQAQQQYYARAVEVRALARAARLRVLTARQRAIYYRDVILPLRQEIVEATQLEYNAMLIGAFELLQAKQAQIAAGAEYIESLRDYWIARTRLDQIRAGRAPSPAGQGPQGFSMTSTTTAPGAESNGDRHD